jgi:hypothetical protein
MPWRRASGLNVQHDGAKPHNGLGNLAALTAAGLADGWNIKFTTQPVQSPDLNILDLGFFSSLKSRVAAVKQNATNIDELITKVKWAYGNYDRDTLDHIWAHLMQCWTEILKVDGSNQYKAPHRGGRREHVRGETAVNLTIDVDEYNRVFAMFP